MDPNLIPDRSSNTKEEEDTEEEDDNGDDELEDDDVDEWWRASSDATKVTIILFLRGLFLGVLSLWMSWVQPLVGNISIYFIK